MSRRRKLTAEERALWDSIARQAVPLKPERIDEPVPDATPVAKTAPLDIPARAPRIPEFRVGENAKPGAATGVGRPKGPALAPPQMDAKHFGRMQKGKLSPEARIDLHGMTVADAHPALVGFILRSHAEGRRLVLVITGKGKWKDDAPPFPVRRGVLRHQVPQWLKLAPLGPLVLEVTPAHVRHGGEGAFYVYLRRSR